MAKLIDHDYNIILTKRKDAKGRAVMTVKVEGWVRDPDSNIKIERNPTEVHVKIPYVTDDWAKIEAAADARAKKECGIT